MPASREAGTCVFGPGGHALPGPQAPAFRGAGNCATSPVRPARTHRPKPTRFSTAAGTRSSGLPSPAFQGRGDCATSPVRPAHTHRPKRTHTIRGAPQLFAKQQECPPPAGAGEPYPHGSPAPPGRFPPPGQPAPPPRRPSSFSPGTTAAFPCPLAHPPRPTPAERPAPRRAPCGVGHIGPGRPGSRMRDSLTAGSLLTPRDRSSTQVIDHPGGRAGDPVPRGRDAPPSSAVIRRTP